MGRPAQSSGNRRGLGSLHRRTAHRGPPKLKETPHVSQDPDRRRRPRHHRSRHAAATQPASAGTRLNGAFLNGIQPNGLFANGTYLNGLFPNGTFLNGLFPNGYVWNGLMLNGMERSATGATILAIELPAAK